MPPNDRLAVQDGLRANAVQRLQHRWQQCHARRWKWKQGSVPYASEKRQGESQGGKCREAFGSAALAGRFYLRAWSAVVSSVAAMFIKIMLLSTANTQSVQYDIFCRVNNGLRGESVAYKMKRWCGITAYSHTVVQERVGKKNARNRITRGDYIGVPSIIKT